MPHVRNNFKMHSGSNGCLHAHNYPCKVAIGDEGVVTLNTEGASRGCVMVSGAEDDELEKLFIWGGICDNTPVYPITNADEEPVVMEIAPGTTRRIPDAAFGTGIMVILANVECKISLNLTKHR